MKNGPLGTGRRGPPSLDPDLTALQALTFIAGDPDHAGRFMALSGIEPGALRAAAADPAFLSGVLDYLVADEPLLLLFAADAGLAPEAVVDAHARLSRR